MVDDWESVLAKMAELKPEKIVNGYLMHADDLDYLKQHCPERQTPSYGFGFQQTLYGVSVWESPYARPGDPIPVYIGETHDNAVERHFTPTPTEPSQ